MHGTTFLFFVAFTCINVKSFIPTSKRNLSHHLITRKKTNIFNNPQQHLSSEEENNNKSQVKLRIIHINDVYLLDHFASLCTLIKQHSEDAHKTLVVMAGDFVGPSLLSSLDRGRGIVDMMSFVGITHCCFGNHEADIPDDALAQRIKESSFKWVNTNMRELDAKLDVTTDEYDVVTVGSKKVAILGLLIADKKLYVKGAFGGAEITPIVDTAKTVVDKLEKTVQPDIIIPLTHQEMPDDRKFAEHFTGDIMPLVLGGHEHEPYDEIISGSRIVKVGMDAINTAIIDVVWDTTKEESKPTVSLQSVKTDSYPKDAAAQARVDNHEKILQELDRAKLFRTERYEGDNGEVFSTFLNRLKPSSGSIVLSSIIRMGMRCDCAIVTAGSIRANKVYDDQEWYTLSNLKTEIPFGTEMTVIEVEGSVIEESIAWSRRGAYANPQEEMGGYLQVCDMIEYNDKTQKIERIRGKKFNPNELYLMAVPIVVLNGMDNVLPLINWAKENDYRVDNDAGRPAKVVIVEYFAALLWLQLGSFADIDADNDGLLTREEIKTRAEEMYGREFADLAIDNILAVADIDGDGNISPYEMLVTQFVATDISLHVVSKDETRIMTQLASEVLGLPPKNPKVNVLVEKLLEKMDTSGSGNMERNEMIAALGTLASESVLV